MSKRAAEQITGIRKSYVQSDILFGLGGGITLADLRDIVSATGDYKDSSRVILEQNRVTVIETTTSPWRRRGREDGKTGE